MATVFQGAQMLPFPKQQVWDALFDVDVLRASIEGCEMLERRGENAYATQVRVAIGPVSASFATTLDVVDPEPPHRCTLRFSGKGGAVGFGRGEARVILTSRGDAETLLEWSASTQVGGKIAQMGTRLIDGTVRKMSDDFFERFARQLVDAASVPSLNAGGAPATETEVPSRQRAATVRRVGIAIALAVAAAALWWLASQRGGR
jgi:carbon monoxide dehydrogenase subunit G